MGYDPSSAGGEELRRSVREITMTRFLTVLGMIGAASVAVMLFRPHPPPEEGKGGYKLGKLMPGHLRDELKLSEEQDKELTEIEAEVRRKLQLILTADQLREIEKMSHRPPEKGKGKDKKGGPPRPEPEVRAPATTEGGIAWFTSLEAGLKEARSLGRPILLVSAAPHCAGVSGMW